MSNRDKELAAEILRQLGGNRFLAMTGAKNLFAHPEKEGQLGGLSFKLPKFAGVKVNYVKIILTPLDVYHVSFGRVYGSKFTVISEHSDVYCDQLASLFEKETGLYTHL